MHPQPASNEHWSRLRADVGRLVARRLSNPSDVEDVVQDVLMRVWRHGPELRDQERFGAWLMRVVFTAAADHFRKRAERPLTSDSDADDDQAVAGPESQPSAEALEATLAAILRPFVDELPAHYREVIVLSELEGLPHAAIADRLSLSVSGVKSRVQRGRQMLRELLEQCCRFVVDGRGAPVACEMRPDAVVPRGFTAEQQAQAGCRGSCEPSVQGGRSSRGG